MDPAEESVEVVLSEDDGNVPAEAPSVTTEPAATTEKEPVTTTEAELFDLPDGRKVDAATLSKEWKENFYPEFTKKSQALAAKEKDTLQNKTTEENQEWVPQSYEEILERAEQRVIQKLENTKQAEVKAQQALETEVATQLSEVKKLDANVNENALFLHATKYGFRDLKLAHQNMKDMSSLAKNVQQTTAKNIAKRSDPVSVSHGATGIKSDPHQFETARDFLRSL